MNTSPSEVIWRESGRQSSGASGWRARAPSAEYMVSGSRKYAHGLSDRGKGKKESFMPMGQREIIQGKRRDENEKVYQVEKTWTRGYTAGQGRVQKISYRSDIRKGLKWIVGCRKEGQSEGDSQVTGMATDGIGSRTPFVNSIKRNSHQSGKADIARQRKGVELQVPPIMKERRKEKFRLRDGLELFKYRESTICVFGEDAGRRIRKT